MTILYSCRHSGDQYRITKFSDDMEVESSYLCTIAECECPAGSRPICRHREMLPLFIARGAIDTGWFYDYERGGWVQSDIGVYEGEGVLTLHDEEIEGLDSRTFEELPQPHSEAVNAGDFDSPGTGSNPVVAARHKPNDGRRV